MYITDKRKPNTVFFGSLKYGEIFAMTDEDDECNKFYLIKTRAKIKPLFWASVMVKTIAWVKFGLCPKRPR